MISSPSNRVAAMDQTNDGEDDNEFGFQFHNSNDNSMMTASPSTPGGGSSFGVVSVPVAGPGTDSNSSSYHDRRHLIRPSSVSPWSVDIVCAVPRVGVVIDHLLSYTTGATCASTSTAGWTCLGLPNGHCHLWQNSSTSATVAGAAAATGAGERMDHPFLVDPPKHVLTLALTTSDATTTTTTTTMTPLIALTPSPDNEYVFCYIAYPTSGTLCLWKVSRKDLLLHGMTASSSSTGSTDSPQQHLPSPQPLPFTALAQLDLDDDEHLTSLHVEGRHTIILGTSTGNMFWCSQTTVPIGLHVQKVLRPTDIHGNNSWSITGGIRTLFGASSSNSSSNHDPNTESEDQSPIIRCFWCNNKTTTAPSFLSISQKGTILIWNVGTPTGNAAGVGAVPIVSAHHHATFQTHFVLSVLSSFREHHPKEDNTAIKQVHVLRVEMNGTSLHMILRVTATVTTTASSITTSEDSSKLYWVRFRYDTNSNQFQWIDSHWLNRFAVSSSSFGEEDDIQVRGLIITDNNFAYTAFHHLRSSTVIIMALKDSAATKENKATPMLVNEVDLPNSHIPGLLPNTLTKDVVTHGCTALSTSGLGIRIRVMENFNNTAAAETQQDQQQQRSSWGITGGNKTSSNPLAVHTLTNHLRTTFWESYKHGNATIRIPPSLNGAKIQDLEAAVVALGKQLQHTGGGSSSLILLEWHHSFIHLLQQGGLYRSLSVQCKWKLLSLGQEAAVFLQLAREAYPQSSSPKKRRKTHNEWGQHYLTELQSFNIANWLKRVFQDVQQGISGTQGIGIANENDDSAGGSSGTTDDIVGHPAYEMWCTWLCSTLEIAMTYRQERGTFMYDINPEQAPSVVISDDEYSAVEDDGVTVVPVWTSHPVLQDLLYMQLQFWTKHLSTAQHQQTQVQIIIHAALQSFADTVDSLNTKLSQERYHSVKSVAIPLLRSIGGDEKKYDYLAFTLSIKHMHFEGLCELALDHEKKSDRKQFLLDPLFSSFSSDNTKKNLKKTFGQFVLQWHCDRKLYGHAIKYGRYCPDDLNYWLKHDERLRPYQWIQSAHSGDYESAAKSLFANSIAHDATLSDAKWALCMAKISNHIVLNESSQQERKNNNSNINSIQNRHVQIEIKLELAKAQEMLLSSQESNKTNDEHKEASSTSTLWPADRLFDLAMKKVNQKNISADDVLKYCLIGLAICSTFSKSDPMKCKHCAAQVWAKSISNDSNLWNDWMHNDMLSRSRDGQYFKDLIMKETIFGHLLQECIKDIRLQPVKYGPFVEKEVLELLVLSDDDSKCEMMRIMLSTTAIN